MKIQTKHKLLMRQFGSEELKQLFDKKMNFSKIHLSKNMKH